MLPRAARLRKEREFRAVFARGPGAAPSSTARPAAHLRPRVQSSPLLTVHLKPWRRAQRETAPALASETPMLRFGFSISKKAAKRAHDRNRAKRRLSEVARVDVLPAYAGATGYDCVVVVRQPAITVEFNQLRAELLRLLTRAGLELRSHDIEPAMGAQ